MNTANCILGIVTAVVLYLAYRYRKAAVWLYKHNIYLQSQVTDTNKKLVRLLQSLPSDVNTPRIIAWSQLLPRVKSLFENLEEGKFTQEFAMQEVTALKDEMEALSLT